MLNISKDRLISLLFGIILGLIIGMVVMSVGGIFAYKLYKHIRQGTLYEPKVTISKKVSPKNMPGSRDFYLSFEKDADLAMLAPTDKVATRRVKEHATHSNYSLMVNIEPQGGYPGIGWEAFGKDAQNWSGAKDFHFDVFNNNESSVTLVVKFKSGKDYPKKAYSYDATLEPLKLNHVSIPMQNIAESCDIAAMSYVKLFVTSPGEPVVLYFDNVGMRDAGAGDKAGAPEKDTGAVKDVDTSSPAMRENIEIFAVSSMDKIFRSGKTLEDTAFTDAVTLSAAKNEYESFQVVVNNGKTVLRSVSIELSDLIDEKTGARITKDKNMVCRVVGYVETQKPYYAVKFVGLWPDPLLPLQKIDIEPGETQPFWVIIYTPQDVPAGIYKGSLKVMCDNKILKEMPVSLHIFDFTLPVSSHLKTAFDFYPHITSKRYPQEEKETPEMYKARMDEINERYIIDMLRHRMDPILNIDPLSEADLGKAELYRRYGLNNFSIGKRGGTFNNNWPKTDEEIEKLLPLYRSYGENLKINKMLGYTYIYTWDEGNLDNPLVPKITSMIHRAYPGLKNMVCYHGFWDPQKDPEWGKDINIWCVGIGDYSESKARALQSIGIEMWIYASGPSSQEVPNLAIDFSSKAYRIIPWLCWKYDIKGFLYWCVNWWPFVDPFKSASNTKWNQNGNGLLFYPGKRSPISSIRLEVFRDGMEDYEYLVMLRDKLKALEGKGDKKALSLLIVDKPLASSMKNYTRDSSVILKQREEIAEAIEGLNATAGKNGE